mmetsp:Transcript_78354/g.127084  ORF Transcript_78354/g.127084 Transcript_78354/m.127084 type:complete len:153 (+) Transcript_78354:848-1306(+)
MTRPFVDECLSSQQLGCDREMERSTATVLGVKFPQTAALSKWSDFAFGSSCCCCACRWLFQTRKSTAGHPRVRCGAMEQRLGVMRPEAFDLHGWDSQSAYHEKLGGVYPDEPLPRLHGFVAHEDCASAQSSAGESMFLKLVCPGGAEEEAFQ